MKIVIHSGIGGAWGLGHACRMRALATALLAQGADVSFLVTTPALQDFVAPFPSTLSAYAWPSCSTPCDVLVEDVPPAAAASPWWYTRLREHIRVVRVDAPTATLDTCDALLAPCAHWDDRTVTRLQSAFGKRFLYGWDYVLLEQDVVEMPRVPSADRGDRPVVFAAGGSDPRHLLPQMLAWAGPPPPVQPWFALVPQYSVTLPPLPTWVEPRVFSRDLLRHAALLVTTFGVTCYEAIYWGIPAFMVASSPSTAEDAVRLMRASRGAVRAVGLPEPDFPDSLRTLIHSLMEQRAERQRMQTASVGLLDGLGAQRAATALLSLERISP